MIKDFQHLHLKACFFVINCGSAQAGPLAPVLPRPGPALLTSLRLGLMSGRFCPFILW